VLHGRLARLAVTSMAAGVAALGCSEASVATVPPAAPRRVETTGAPSPVQPPADPVVVKLDGGCDEAKEAYVKECTDKGCPDRNASQLSYGEVLNGGTYLDACKSPPSTMVKICAAIRNGRAVAVTVTTAPGDGHVATCIGRAVQGLSFPSSPRLDVTSTVFAAQ
jgi:hypothetical protein